MSLVRIKNITVGKLVFLAVRDFSGEPLTLEAGEEKDVFPSMASQPSIQRVLGTKVLILEEKKEPVKEPVKEPTVVIAETPVPVVKEVIIPQAETPSVAVTPEESPVRKTRRGRR